MTHPDDHPTRRALLAAASRMMRELGELPSIAEVAEAAKISRRTAYRYFPTAEEFALAAALEVLRPEMRKAMAVSRNSNGPEGRAVATARGMVRVAFANEGTIRAMIRHSMNHPAGRGQTRFEWFREAVEPLGDRVDASTRERLVEAFMLTMSFQGIVDFADFYDKGTRATADVTAWVAEALVRHALAETKRKRKP